jgi:sulfide:quinone oxidoreductase
VVCGGGVAGVEGLLRLRRLAGDRIRMTLVTPQDDFLYRPLAVREPFARASIRRYPIARIAVDTGATRVRDRLASIDTDECAVHTEGGQSLSYDAALLAIGAGQSPPFEHGDVFTDRDGGQSFRSIVAGIEHGQVRNVAFVIPNWPVWPVPLYELALMTAAHARDLGAAAQLTLVTPEGRPLKALGRRAGEAIERLLAASGVELLTGAVASVPEPGTVRVGERTLDVDRIVTLPRITGPAVPGLAAGPGWFIPIDGRCTVLQTDGRVFAAGDATDYPVKHGGISAQQADTAAAGIAHLAGTVDRPAPFQPVIRSMLLTGERPLYLMARVVDGVGWRSEAFDDPPWPPGDKIIAEELGPYLTGLDRSG